MLKLQSRDALPRTHGLPRRPGGPRPRPVGARDGAAVASGGGGLLWCLCEYTCIVGATNLDNLVKHGFTLLPRAGCGLVFRRRFPGVQALLDALPSWLCASAALETEDGKYTQKQECDKPKLFLPPRVGWLR